MSRLNSILCILKYYSRNILSYVLREIYPRAFVYLCLPHCVQPVDNPTVSLTFIRRTPHIQGVIEAILACSAFIYSSIMSSEYPILFRMDVLRKIRIG